MSISPVNKSISQSPDAHWRKMQDDNFLSPPGQRTATVIQVANEKQHLEAKSCHIVAFCVLSCFCVAGLAATQIDHVRTSEIIGYSIAGCSATAMTVIGCYQKFCAKPEIPNERTSFV